MFILVLWVNPGKDTRRSWSLLTWNSEKNIICSGKFHSFIITNDIKLISWLLNIEINCLCDLIPV